MNYQIKNKLSGKKLKYYYQGKMLNDADELALYDEYLEWLKNNRTLEELQKMSDFLDSAIPNIHSQPKNEARRELTIQNIKERLKE